MQFTCDKNELVKAVGIVTKAVTGKSALPILECIYLKAEDNKLVLIGNDLDLGIRTEIDATVREEGDIALNARMFSEIIRRLPNAVVGVNENDNREVKITSGLSEFSLKGQDPTQFPELPTVGSGENFVLSQKVFRDMIKNTIFSIAPEDFGRPVMTGELMDIRDGYLYLVSVDGFRISMRRCAANFEQDKKAVIPGKALNELQKILEGEDDALVNISLVSNHAKFEIDRTVVLTRLVDGEFLQYQRNLNMEYPAFAQVNTKELLESVDRAALISRECKNSHIRFQIEAEKITITSNAESSSVHEELPCVYNGEDLTIAFNPKYFMDALKAIESEKINIYFSTSLIPCILKDPDNDDYKYLILPIRLHN